MRWTTMLTVSSRTTARTPRVITRPTWSESNSSSSVAGELGGAGAGGGLGGVISRGSGPCVASPPSTRVHDVGLGLRKSATRGETMPVAKRLNAWYVRRMCVARALAWRVPSPNPSPTLAEA